MSLIPRLTLIGLYNFNNSLFSNLLLPDDLENQTFIDTLLMKYGECPLISPNIDYMILAIGAWSRKWYDNIERMTAALKAEYNPIHNFDRHEEWSGTDGYTISGTDGYTISGTDSRTIENSGTSERTFNGTDEHKVSAYNESDYQEDNIDLSEISETIENENTTENDGTRSETKSGTKGETKTGTDSKTAHLYGNVGVTTSQEMVEAELILRSKNTIYDIISELFYKEFCIYIF